MNDTWMTIFEVIAFILALVVLGILAAAMLEWIPSAVPLL